MPSARFFMTASLYIAEMDYAAEQHERNRAFYDGYASRHAPDLFKLGARSVASRRPVGGGFVIGYLLMSAHHRA